MEDGRWHAHACLREMVGVADDDASGGHRLERKHAIGADAELIDPRHRLEHYAREA